MLNITVNHYVVGETIMVKAELNLSARRIIKGVSTQELTDAEETVRNEVLYKLRESLGDEFLQLYQK